MVSLFAGVNNISLSNISLFFIIYLSPTSSQNPTEQVNQKEIISK